MPLSFCYYHIVWAVKHRQPLLTPSIEKIAIATIRRKSHQLQSAIYAINGLPDHLHVAVSIPPRLAIATWVRETKGLSAREINQHVPDADTRFTWQKGYSVHSFGKKVLPFIVRYIENQKLHHADNTLEPYLEQLENETQHP